ncbi:pirin family protein [Nocardia arthritidis]|nr:pirin family protein [Nocardia arthritidis]
MTTTQLPGHAVSAVRDRVERGATSQVDRSAQILAPGNWADTDPFLLMAEDWFGRNGFDWHPHRGFETITYVVEGELEHRDNRGGHGVLRVGDAQWMTAGSGVVHAELAHNREFVHTLQLWINLPAADKFTEPAYQDLRGGEMPVRTEDGARVRVFSGRSGDVTGPARNHVPITFVDVTVQPGHALRQEIPAGQRGFAYVLAGSGLFGSDRTPAHAGQTVHLAADAAETALEVTADGHEPLHFLLWTGTPLGEPVAAYGPFVMNTPAQIQQTLVDYSRGAFGPIPGE